MKQLLKKTLCFSTIYYTLAIIAFSTIMLISHTDESSLALAPSRILYIYLFCLSFATANVILKHTNIQAVARWILHLILTVAGAYMFIILPADLESSSGNFMGLMIILVLYVVGVLLSLLFSVRIKRAMREDAEIKKNSKAK
ncbi:MAG: hypothetical protein J6S14_18285 [Clostridia bacterium]|nr:hypothetical protein [Clostridia bacterium]